LIQINIDLDGLVILICITVTFTYRGNIMKQNLVHLLVKECMTPYVITIGPFAGLDEAHRIMNINMIRRLPVVGNNDKNLVGIVTKGDILEAKPSDVSHSLTTDEVNLLLSTILVDTVYTRNPITIIETDTIGQAAELMLDKKIGCLPVIDENKKLVGLITESDIFRAIVRKWRDDNRIHAQVA